MNRSRVLSLGFLAVVIAGIAIVLAFANTASVTTSSNATESATQASITPAEFATLTSDEQQAVVDAMPKSEGLAESDEGTTYQSGTVLVSFKEQAFEDGSETLTESANAAISSLVSVEPADVYSAGKIDDYTATLKVRDGISVSKAVAEVNNNDNFEASQANYRYEIAASTNDPKQNYQWAINNASETVKKAWDEQKVNGSVTVAVIDTGIDTDHEDLKDNIVEATTRIERSYWTGSTTAWYWDTSDPEDKSSVGHGSHCAGVVSAVSNNGKGVSGISYNAKILSIRVFEGAYAWSSDVCKGIEYAIEKKNDYNVRVISLSLGSSSDWQDPVYNRTTKKATDAGITVVGASGNDSANFVSAPANCDSVIAVGAVNSSGQRSSFSNYGSQLDVMAPGYSIYSTGRNNNYLTMDGTSMAAPYVAAVAALCYAANPDLTPAQFEKLLKETASKSSNQSTLEYGAGKVNPYKAVLAAKELICYHDATDVYVLNNVQPTCKSEGYSGDTYCPKCNKMIEKGYTIAKLNHDTETHVTKEPTCTQTGTKVEVCKSCGETQNTIKIEATGHSNITYFNEVAATCTSNKYTACSICLTCYQFVDVQREIKGSKIAHDYDEQGNCKNCNGKSTDEEEIYHLYNKTTEEHLYTPDKTEYESKIKEDNWEDKGVAWIATTVESASTTKVHRLYSELLDKQGKACHYYSTSEAEIYFLTGYCGWKDEGENYAFLSGGDVAIWMTYKDKLLGNSRYYTADESEWKTLGQEGWNLETEQNGATGVFQAIRLAK